MTNQERCDLTAELFNVSKYSPGVVRLALLEGLVQAVGEVDQVGDVALKQLRVGGVTLRCVQT